MHFQDGSGAANSAGESPTPDADGAASQEKASTPEPPGAGTDMTLEGVVQVCTLCHIGVPHPRRILLQHSLELPWNNCFGQYMHLSSH